MVYFTLQEAQGVPLVPRRPGDPGPLWNPRVKGQSAAPRPAGQSVSWRGEKTGPRLGRRCQDNATQSRFRGTAAQAGAQAGAGAGVLRQYGPRRTTARHLWKNS